MRFRTWLLASLSFTCSAIAISQAKDKTPVEYVSPNIGGIGQLLTATVPYVQYPHGMMRIAPITTPGTTDRYLAEKIYGFPAGPAILMASVGDAGSSPAAYASQFDHDKEISTPYYYQADLESWAVNAEVSVTQRAAYYRFTFPKSAHAHLVFSVSDNGQLSVTGSNTVAGSARVTDRVSQTPDHRGDTRCYFYAEFSRDVSPVQSWNNGSFSQAKQQSGNSIGLLSDFPTREGEQIEVRVGMSYISTEQARKNLQREIPSWNFETVKSRAYDIWNQTLSAISIEGGTDKQRTIFYTALYRSLGRMTNITEDGSYFSGFDHRVHQTEGRDFYVNDGLWDTFRSLHPLQTLLDGHRQEDMVRSYLRMYEQSGWLPSFPSVAGEQPFMIGHHAAPFILDLYQKGYRDFDVQEAYTALRKNATEATMLPWSRAKATPLDRFYFDHGYFPALARGEKESSREATRERRQAVSVTIENSYDDWCVAELAKLLGKDDDARSFTRRSQNYRNVFNKTTQFMAPKTAGGRWVLPFDPKLGGGQGGREYFTESNAWLYTFGVQHDVKGLIGLFGGPEPFNAKLDKLFVEQYGTAKYTFLGKFPDATGLVGLYPQGNEPSFHIPYLYDLSGQPWKTQRRVRQLMDVWYGDTPLGIPGDDDGGETSSWYVLSALGFYQVCPGDPTYEIGSPLFAKSVIRMGNGKSFTVLALHTSARNKYIQSAQLNGRLLNKASFQHSDIAEGGTLVLEMGDKPNYLWGIGE